jgi:hypothetical protein
MNRVVIDRIQRQATSDKRQWTMFSHLEDLDFAEISGNNTHLQEKTDRMNKYARQTTFPYVNCQMPF